MKISFIIPAFNSQDFIARCLESILSQPFDDFEVLVVNDGSTDGTGVVVESFMERDARISQIHQPNSGQGAARNNGIKHATGDYIWFIDSDDWLLDRVLPRILEILNKSNPDVMVINYEYSFENAPAQAANVTPSYLIGEMINPKDSQYNFSAVSCWNTPPWRLIANRSLVNMHNIKFAEGVFFEDHPFAIELMLRAQRVYVDGCISYSYFQRGNSTTKLNDEKSFDFIEIRKQCIGLFKKFGMLDEFPGVVTEYIAPVNFYIAHVPNNCKKDFLTMIRQDLTPEDLEFAKKFGDTKTRLFLEAVVSEDPAIIVRHEKLAGLRSKYSIAGAGRYFARVKATALSRIIGFARRLRSVMISDQDYLGLDVGSQRYLSAGSGTRIEPIHIDVRTEPESRSYVTIGQYSHVGGYFVFERGIGQVTIGDRSSIGGGCKIIVTQKEGITIGNNVMLSWDCTLCDSNSHSLNPDIRANDAYNWKCSADVGKLGVFKDWSQVASAPIKIEDDVWIGFEVAIMKGVTIGRGAVIGAKSVVTRDVAPYCIYAGNPARFVGFVPKDTWTYGDIVQASQGNPRFEKTLIQAYIHKDIFKCFKEYMASDEYKETLRLFERYHDKAKAVLDVGGGSGITSIAFALAGYNVTLVEPSNDSIVGVQAANLLVKLVSKEFDDTLPERVEIIQSTIEAFEPRNPFDVVYCRQVVHHFEHPIMSLSKIKSLMKDGESILVMSREHVVVNDSELEVFLNSHPFHQYTKNEMAYSLDAYLDFISKAGFDTRSVIRFKESPINYFPHDSVSIQNINEEDVAGRPYTFIASMSGHDI